MTESRTSARKLTALERERESLALRMAGYTYEQIGDKLGITRQGAYAAVVRALKKLREKVLEDAEQLRSLELRRLDSLFLSMYQQAEEGDQGAVDRCLRIMERRSRLMGLDIIQKETEETAVEDIPLFSLPANSISASFYDIYRDIRAHKHIKYVLKGGRGSTKSSFASEVVIEQLINNPDYHGLALRQVANTLRDSVYSQLVWAINYLGLSDKFKCTVSPLQIEYLPTGQIIYFRGGDEPLNIKSIKPKFGAIGILWFEELDQFRGENAIRSIYQSAIRGGDKAIAIYSFNPPRSKNNWVYKWLNVPDSDRYVHHSTYLDVPGDWLGEAFIREADHVKNTNPKAYKHEYLGEAVALGGLVFDNLVLRAITDDEIAVFDRILHGLDWGFTIDPASYGKMHYDAARSTLYIFNEYRGWKEGNRVLYDHILETGYDPKQLIIPDSAEPKSIADFRSYGAFVRGAEKGPDSVRYSMKWLESRVKIVIDPVRAPYHAEEFSNYEYEQNKDGEFISAYPDKNNHAIDDTRYATNLIWRRRGQ